MPKWSLPSRRSSGLSIPYTKIWLIGYKGMLGSEMEDILRSHHLPFVATDKEVDIRQFDRLLKFATEEFTGILDPVIINCAGYSGIDRAEDELSLCHELNIFGTANISRLAHRLGASLFHISSDLVFGKTPTNDTGLPHPWSENMETNPCNAFGSSKAKGEEEIRSLLPAHFILRVSQLYGCHGPNLVNQLYQDLQLSHTVEASTDHEHNLTWTRDVAQLIATIIRRPYSERPPFGTYHVCTNDTTTPFMIASEIHRQLQAKGIRSTMPVATTETTSPSKKTAYKPKSLILSTRKIERLTDCIMPSWIDSLTTYLKTLPDLLPSSAELRQNDPFRIARPR
jgi:dTDP-4-dehydrorhamnose reductase